MTSKAVVRFAPALVIGAIVLVMLAARPAASAQSARRDTPRLTVKQLQGLKSTSNDPQGDSFVDTKERLGGLIDAFAADSSLASPMLLFFAANTAARLARVEDAGFLFYAAQMRAAFDFKRYDVEGKGDGENAAIYLGFLNQTTGAAVNPAIMREPKRFASVVARLEAWDLLPAADAFYPEFEGSKPSKLPRAEWPAAARAVKERFLTEFARKTLTLLNDPEYFAAFTIVQDVNFGNAADFKDPATQARLKASYDRMAAAEARLFPGAKTVTPQPRP
jgi:hypothetical protein